MVRDTISLTVLQGGTKVNVIPSEAIAKLDCRLIPGSSKKDFLGEVKKRLGEESRWRSSRRVNPIRLRPSIRISSGHRAVRFEE